MKTVTGIEIAAAGSGTVTIGFPGGLSTSVDKAVLFDRQTIIDQQIIANFRFAYLIVTGDQGADPTSGVLKNYINTQKQPAGLQLIHFRPVFVSVVQQSGDGRWLLGYGFSAADQSYSVEITADTLQDQTDEQPTIWNIGTFLRLTGHDDITPEAIAAVRSASFRMLG